MASGKSTLGKKLAQDLGVGFIDTDKEIEKKAGADISWIFEVEGENGFRKRETMALKKSIEKDDIVISTGGGIITVEKNSELMKAKGKVIYLKTPLEVQVERTKKDKKRPLLAGMNKKEILMGLKKERDPKYQSIADITINLSQHKNKKSIISEIIEKLSNE